MLNVHLEKSQKKSPNQEKAHNLDGSGNSILTIEGPTLFEKYARIVSNILSCQLLQFNPKLCNLLSRRILKRWYVIATE